MTHILLLVILAVTSPYAGQEIRAVKSLSDKEIASLQRGDGMGFAKLAELNHYPGPKHVLAIAGQLELSAEQLDATRALFADMRREAVRVGEAVIAAEAALDRAFASGSITEASLEQSLQEIARLRAALRNVHLQAHLQQRALLSDEQVGRYDNLRGYTGAHADSEPEAQSHQH